MISWDGKLVTPCCMDQDGEYSLGEFKSIKEAWNNQRIRALRRAHLDGSWRQLALCRDCTYPQLSGLSRLGVTMLPNLQVKKILPFLERLSFGNWGLPELMRFRIICQPAVFMRRSALEQVGYLDETFHFMLDHHFWMRIAARFDIKHAAQLWAGARHHDLAKNVAQSKEFAAETYRAVAWLKANPEFSVRFKADRRRILGGANRLAGRYLLDGGLPGPALTAYGKAMLYWPGYAIKHWGRISFAFMNLLGFGKIKAWSRRQIPQMDDPRLINWPGINLGHGR